MRSIIRDALARAHDTATLVSSQLRGLQARMDQLKEDQHTKSDAARKGEARQNYETIKVMFAEYCSRQPPPNLQAACSALYGLPLCTAFEAHAQPLIPKRCAQTRGLRRFTGRFRRGAEGARASASARFDWQRDRVDAHVLTPH